MTWDFYPFPLDHWMVKDGQGWGLPPQPLIWKTHRGHQVWIEKKNTLTIKSGVFDNRGMGFLQLVIETPFTGLKWFGRCTSVLTWGVSMPVILIDVQHKPFGPWNIPWVTPRIAELVRINLVAVTLWPENFMFARFVPGNFFRCSWRIRKYR